MLCSVIQLVHHVVLWPFNNKVFTVIMSIYVCIYISRVIYSIMVHCRIRISE